MGLKRALFLHSRPGFWWKYNVHGIKCRPSAIWGGGGGSSDSFLAMSLAIKGDWGTVWVARVHSARMIGPMHPVPYLQIWEVLQTTETIKVGQESFIMHRKKQLLCDSRGGVKPLPPPIDPSPAETETCRQKETLFDLQQKVHNACTKTWLITQLKIQHLVKI